MYSGSAIISRTRWLLSYQVSFYNSIRAKLKYILSEFLNLLHTRLQNSFISLPSPTTLDSQSSQADRQRETRILQLKIPKLPQRRPRSVELPLQPTMSLLSQPRSARPQRKSLPLPMSKMITTKKRPSPSLLLLRSVLRERKRILPPTTSRLRTVGRVERLRAWSRSLPRRESVHPPSPRLPRETLN